MVNGTIDGLKFEISNGASVIVFIRVEESYESPHNTHYVSIVGYDEDYFYFAESLDYLANCKDQSDLIYNRKTKISKFQILIVTGKINKK
ncbi:C39 family peptidase [Candidatus Stoquefichus massiliensis]|uniref:C39 family peptidase n=1 Tax=Candidatus Stoquefichus massiliensis TaxID=1470350 RepID=UPI0021C31A0E|nr:C39 family peptidase [Candidatus Stoquefichus massiliensis]